MCSDGTDTAGPGTTLWKLLFYCLNEVTGVRLPGALKYKFYHFIGVLPWSSVPSLQLSIFVYTMGKIIVPSMIGLLWRIDKQINNLS